MEATVFSGASLGKDPEIVDQLSQGLLQFGVTNFAMIAQVDPRILGFLAPYVFENSKQFFRATQETDSPLLDGIRENMEHRASSSQACRVSAGRWVCSMTARTSPRSMI